MSTEPTNELGYWLEAAGILYHPESPAAAAPFCKVGFSEAREFVARRMREQAAQQQTQQRGAK